MTSTPNPLPDKRPVSRDQSETALEAALCRLELERAMSALMTGALERIASGAYGPCARCSAEIAPERLRALPWVRMCADCQDMHGSSATTATSGGDRRCIDNSGA